MASTRDVIAPPIFAEDASTVIPPTPIAGVSYRDPVAGPASSPDGWPYAQLVNSAEWNQLMFQWSSLLSIIDLKGLLGWTSLKDYTEDAIAFGSDGQVYKWLQESGPGTLAGVQDPVSSPAYWQMFGVDFLNTQRVDVAAASNIDLTALAPSTSHIRITGAASVSGFTVAAGRCFFVTLASTPTFVNGAPIVTGTGANAVGAAGDTFLLYATANNVVQLMLYRAAPGYIQVQDQKAQNTPGGSSVAGVQTRVLNTVVSNSIAGASLSSNQITLPAGTYEVEAWATVRDVDRNRIVLYNVTGAAILILGSSEDATSNLNSRSTLSGRFTITATTVFEIRHYTQLAVATNGLGIETNQAGVEIYANAEFRRVV